MTEALRNKGVRSRTLLRKLSPRAIAALNKNPEVVNIEIEVFGKTTRMCKDLNTIFANVTPDMLKTEETWLSVRRQHKSLMLYPSKLQRILNVEDWGTLREYYKGYLAQRP